MDSQDNNKHHHHILSKATGLKVFAALLVFTVITVAASRVDFGALNFAIAMLIATVKALMVVLIFMGLKYDDNENRVIFFSSFVFVAIFILLTATDNFTRGDYRVKGPFLKESSSAVRVKKPWESTPELVTLGKQVFAQQCVSCHGAEGHGDGSAAGSLNPKPRNFHDEAGWKNGRKPSQIFGTLVTGLNNVMPSFKETIPNPDERWAVAHYILTFGPAAPADDIDSLKKVGYDPALGDYGRDGAAVDTKRKIPVEFAIERYISK